MDILIHSLLDNVRKFNASLHIRYYAKSQVPAEATTPACQQMASQSLEGSKTMTSYVIIRREYSYLEPLIRSMFKDAADVTVLIDRRSEERRDPLTSSEERGRQHDTDRRSSAPMLDILINVEP